MSNETVDTLVVGAGQAGIAMSEHLRGHGVPHLVLERDRIAERWRTARWDSLVANGPAWHDRFPGLAFPGDPNAFVPKDQVAQYFVDYAANIDAPIRCGVDVLSVEHQSGRPGFHVRTSDGEYDVLNVVAATGAFQRPVIPALVPDDTNVVQIHSAGYRNPEQLPAGATLVVGAGSSGSQIAEELLQSGRTVYLSVGPHDRPPRRYRGLDFVWWLGVLGRWDAPAVQSAMEHVTISVSGAEGGHTIDFRNMAARGMVLLGMADGYTQGKLTFAGDLGRNLAAGDANYLSMLDEADAYVEQRGFELPEEPEARVIPPDPECVIDPIRELDLEAAGIASIIWATGFQVDYSWLRVDTFNDVGRPRHHRGVSEVPGVYFLGLPWQTRRASSFIFGVWQDAKYLADHIAAQRAYLAHAAHGSE